MKKIIGWCILPALIFLCLFGQTYAQTPLKKAQGSLYEQVKKVSENLLKKDSNAFRIPTQGQLKAWRFITENILKNRAEDAWQMINQLSFPYDLRLFTDKQTKREYILLEEKTPFQAGWGLYIFDLNSRSNLILEIPHPVSDANTEFQGVDAFLQTEAKVFMLAGAHRRANTQPTKCTQPKSADEDATYPVSDVAHSVDTPFHVVHETVVSLLPNAVAVQLHGMVEREICPNVFMSSGTKSVTTNSETLQNCLTKYSVENAVFGKNSECPLTAVSNVQGRFSNGEIKNPCQKQAQKPIGAGRFIHIEQEPNIRRSKESWQPVIDALKCAFPVEENNEESEKTSFIFKSEGNPDVKVFYFAPPKISAKTKVIMVMTGRGRNAEDYHEAWLEWAKVNNYFVLTPYFDDKNWVEPLGYNFGNIASGKEKNNTPNPQSKWAFTIIEKIFAEARQKFSLKTEKYDLFGHSAGGQFVHRFMLFYPQNHVRIAIAANPGFYTLPDLEAEFPYGLKNSPVKITQKDLEEWTKRKVIIMRGTADIERTENLRQSPEADAQGQNRFERALFMFNKIKNLNPQTNWTLVEVPNVAHEQKGMALAAQKVLERKER